jgi:phage portal protein BeeE
LSQEREALWARIERSRFLTLNEKRAAVGYGPVPGGDRLSDGSDSAT